MKEQFRVLVVEPFVEKKLRNGSEILVIILDGLDECGGDPAEREPDQTRSRERTGDYVQCEIVRLISNFVLQYPLVPLIWIIASRPEKYLQAVFYDEDVQPSFEEEDIPVDSIEACEDVEKFLNSEFTQIRKKYPDHIPEIMWPSSKDFLLITKAASGLFIFAEVVIRFIDDPMVKNPIAQLGHVLSAISKISWSHNQKNPLAVLYAIYTEIISRIPPNMLEAAKKLIAHCGCELSGFNLCLISNYLGITRDVAITVLYHLHSVMYIPSVKDIGVTRPRFYHASFRDFLENPSRSHEFSIKKFGDNDEILQGLFNLVQTGRLCSMCISFVVPCLVLTLLLAGLVTASSLPWPGEKSLKVICDRIENMMARMHVTDAQLPLFFANIDFARFIGGWPSQVSHLDTITVCFWP